jgi:hypothetical protein
MKMFAGRRLAMPLAAVALLAVVGVVAWLGTSGAGAQDVEGKATYGVKELETGFRPDPQVIDVQAGGPIQTDKGGVKAFVAKNPDFRLHFKAGKYPLTFHVDSTADTTLLINLPDGSWVADDDSAGNFNPQIRLATPKSGRYEIWVGTIKDGKTPPARLYITELK